MGKFDAVTEKYRLQGVREDNIEFATDSIRQGTERAIILEGLTADYRGMEWAKANAMLDELYQAYGGEFKKESSIGYLIGLLVLVIGSLRLIFRTSNRSAADIAKDPLGIIIAGGVLLLIAGYFFVKAYRGKFREHSNPVR